MDARAREKLLLSANLLLQFLGHSLYGVFVPVFLLKNGVPISGVLLYALADGLGAVLAALAAPYLIRRLSLKFPLVFRALFQPVWLLALMNYKSLPLPPQAYGFMFGIYTTLYWTSMNVYTFGASGKGERGLFAGMTSAVVWIASIVAPLMGGFIIERFGYGSVFTASLAILLLAIVPALLLPKIEYCCAEKGKRVREYPERKANLGALLLAYSILGSAIVGLYYVWPLYTFLLFGGEIDVGIFASLGAFFGLIGALGGGWLADRASKARLIATAGIVSALSWILSVVSTGQAYLYYLVSMRKAGDEVAGAAVFAKYSNLISGEDVLSRMSQKQLAQGTGQAVLGMLSLFLPFEAFFVLMGMAFLLMSAVVSETKFHAVKRRLLMPERLAGLADGLYRLR